MSKRKKKINKNIYNPTSQTSMLLVNDIQDNPDRLFVNSSVDYQKYQDLKYLDVVAKCEVASKSFAKKFPSEIVQADSSPEVYEYIQGLWDGTIDGIDLKKSQDDLLEFILPGFAVTQLIQGIDNKGNKTIIDTVVQPQNYFAFTNQGDLVTSDSVMSTKSLDTELEFLVTRDNIAGGNFYGLGVAKSIYYDAQILKDLNKFVHQTAAKSAVPAVVVIHKSLGVTDTEATANATKTSLQFQRLRSGSAVSVVGIEEIKELKGGDPQKLVDVVRIYESKVCERYIGNADLIQHFDGGSYAKLTELSGLVKVFAEPRNIVLESALNELIARIVKVRFGKEIQPPRIKFDREEKADPKLVLDYYKEGIEIKTESMPSFVGATTETVKKEAVPTNLNLSDDSKKKTFNLTL